YVSIELWSVYPRWRGEHFKELAADVDRIGLSPLARGTLRRPAPQEKQLRFIPAGAGNTRLNRFLLMLF
ncbi:hypothetical protein SEEM675_20820, partial [Salmonella enterica subsp. enterica serovar Montevideo str. OH_2009072675]